RNGPTGFAWGTLHLPHIEQGNLHNRFDLTQPCWAPANATAARTKVPLFLCPSASGGSDGFEVEQATADPKKGTPFVPAIFFAHSHYVTNSGVPQPWVRTPASSFDFTFPDPLSA